MAQKSPKTPLRVSWMVKGYVCSYIRTYHRRIFMIKFCQKGICPSQNTGALWIIILHRSFWSSRANEWKGYVFSQLFDSLKYFDKNCKNTVLWIYSNRYKPFLDIVLVAFCYHLKTKPGFALHKFPKKCG